ncbi:MAG: transposase, partial [Deltaproteobacteria bacterium]|nr:transposase [Deltaproteobacteria bacterium]
MPDGDDVTARAGAVLVYEVMLALGMPELVRRFIKIQQRPGQHSDFDKLADLVMTLANGGECIEDSRALAADEGLWRLIGRTPASPETLRQFLYGFHDETLVTKAQRAAQARGVAAYIVEETERLRGLAEVNKAFIRRVAKRLRLKKATLDHDATVIESHKKQAQAHYKGGLGYQPAAIYWCEADLVVGDEYRDGNVPAGMENLRLIQRGFAALPKGVRELYFRADTACYDVHVLKWLADERSEDGPSGPIGFAIGADMTEALA